MAKANIESSFGGVGIERFATAGQTVGAFVLSALKWFVQLNAIAIWIVFWGNLVRLHATMNQFVGAGLSFAMFFGPLIVAFLWWGSRKAGFHDRELI